MNRLPFKLLILFLFFSFSIQLIAQNRESVYTQKFNDPEAYYFTSENYPFQNDGKTDVSDALQKAINQVKTEKNYGILFISEGKYKISKTITIPKAIRLIGYGKNRPEFILAENSPGFQTNEEKYMVWFTSNLVDAKNQAQDANPENCKFGHKKSAENFLPFEQVTLYF